MDKRVCQISFQLWFLLVEGDGIGQLLGDGLFVNVHLTTLVSAMEVT